MSPGPLFLVAATLSAALLIPVGAASAAPPNDTRSAAITVKPPEFVSGTLVGAGLEAAEQSPCGRVDASVWYRFTAPERGRIIAQLDAAGEMDATVELYRRTRSRYDFVDCEETNDKGRAVLERGRLEPGADYALRIGNLAGSDAAKFRLGVLIPSPVPDPPGEPLPAKGARGTVNRLGNLGDAFSRKLSEGRTMRVSLSAKSCVGLAIFAPGTESFEDSPASTLRCGGFGLFTAEESGRYSFLVVSRVRDELQRYRLQVKPAGRDDTAPGVFIRNYATVRGKVDGRIDARDLYRFDVSRRSALTLRVSGNPEVELVRSGGRRIDVGQSIRTNLKPGRYFAAVSGKGSYTLRRVSRTITRSTVSFAGRRNATVSPGTTVPLRLAVSPGVSGPGRIKVDRFDPIDGWQHVRTYRVSVSGGSGTLSFRPPSVGRYRASAEFLGTRGSAPSETGTARLFVRGPLVD